MLLVVVVVAVVVLESSVVAGCTVEVIPTVGAASGVSESLESMLDKAGILSARERGLRRSPSADTAIKAATTIYQSSAITPSLPDQSLSPGLTNKCRPSESQQGLDQERTLFCTEQLTHMQTKRLWGPQVCSTKFGLLKRCYASKENLNTFDTNMAW